MGQMDGILDHAPRDTRVAGCATSSSGVEVDGRESKAIAVRKATTDQGVNGRMQYTSGSGGRARTCDRRLTAAG